MRISIQPPLRRWFRRAIVIGLIFVAIAATRKYRHRSILFDESRWKAARTDDDLDHRFRMVPSIEQMIAKGELQTREDFLAHLGPPAVDRGSMLLYNLGPEHNSLFRIDND